MKLFIMLFLLAIVMVLDNNADIISASPSEGVMFINQKQNAASSENSNDIYFTQAEVPDSDDFYDDPRGRGRFYFPPSLRSVKRCNRYPGVCQAEGSPGPDCCKNRCVNVSNNRLNCGMCGRKCRFLEMCCNGGCENLMFNNENCGSCGTKCEGGTTCFLGMCSYG